MTWHPLTVCILNSQCSDFIFDMLLMVYALKGYMSVKIFTRFVNKCPISCAYSPCGDCEVYIILEH